MNFLSYIVPLNFGINLIYNMQSILLFLVSEYCDILLFEFSLVLSLVASVIREKKLLLLELWPE